MSGNLTIRSVNASDKIRWTELMKAYANFYEVEVDDTALATTWNWIEDPNNSFWCTLAEQQDGTIVGFTQYQLMHRSLSGAMVCYLSDLYVEPELRGGGVGRALTNHVFDFARDNSIPNVRWLTQDSNAVARKLYDSYGDKSGFILYSFPVTST